MTADPDVTRGALIDVVIHVSGSSVSSSLERGSYLAIPRPLDSRRTAATAAYVTVHPTRCIPATVEPGF